ncbi:MAG: hypothetical protein ACE14S_01380 [Candidatus Bathyarchaeia archaeon]
MFQANAATEWATQTVDPARDAGGYSSIVLDSTDNPHISYRAAEGRLKYASWNGTSWNTETINPTGGTVSYASLALNSTGYPHIAFSEWINGNVLRYSHWNGTTWNTETVDSTFWTGAYCSLALDAEDKPHIGYSAGSPSVLKYAVKTNSTWSIETVDSAQEVGTYNSIAVDSASNPHISYYDAFNGDLKYASFNGSDWVLETVDSNIGRVGEHTSLALDSGDNPHISYYDYQNLAMKYAWWNGTQWNKETIASQIISGDRCPLALDSSNVPHVAYRGSTGWLTYAHRVGSAWASENLMTAVFSNSLSLTMDSADKPHLSYHGGPDANLKHTFAQPADTGLNVSVNPPSQTVTAGGSAIFDVNVTLLSGSPGSVSLSLNLPSSVGVCSFEPSSGTPTFVSELTINTFGTAPPGVYNLVVTATLASGLSETATLTLTVATPPKLTLNISPKIVARGTLLSITGRLTPARTATIQLYYRLPHETGIWQLATTLTTDPAGFYGGTATVPMWLTAASYDLVAIWFNGAPGGYTASPVRLLTIT